MSIQKMIEEALVSHFTPSHMEVGTKAICMRAERGAKAIFAA